MEWKMETKLARQQDKNEESTRKEKKKNERTNSNFDGSE